MKKWKNFEKRPILCRVMTYWSLMFFGHFWNLTKNLKNAISHHKNVLGLKFQNYLISTMNELSNDTKHLYYKFHLHILLLTCLRNSWFLGYPQNAYFRSYQKNFPQKPQLKPICHPHLLFLRSEFNNYI